MVNKKNIVMLSLILMAALIVGVAYLSKQKYDSLLKATSEGLALGRAYGTTISQGNCIIGLKVKYASCSTMECELSANGYISGCMQTAKKDEFCTAVPNIKDTDKTIDWANKTCDNNQLNGEKCRKYIHKFVSTCTEQNESRTISKGELIESGFKKGLRQAAE